MPESHRTTVANLKHLGGKVPPGAVYVGRAGHGESGYFGNPYTVQTHGASALPRFKAYFEGRLASDPEFHVAVQRLRGKTLVCFCRPQGGFQGRVRCHAQIIAAYLDGINPEDVP
jgi:hypothetical protein